MAKKPEGSSKGTALATRPASTLAKPGGKIGGRGLENIERSDVLLPRLKLLQSMSPEVTGELGMKPGTMVVSLSNKSYGTKVLITPILHFRSRVKWLPKDDGGGIECSSPDARVPVQNLFAPNCAECKHALWDNDAKKKKDQQPKCTLYDNFLVFLGNEKEPVIIPMEKTKAKAAKRFYSMAALKGGDLWNSVYELTTVKETNKEDQTYFNYSVLDIGKATDEARRLECEKVWNSLHTKTLKTDVENPEEEGTQEPAAAGSKF